MANFDPNPNRPWARKGHRAPPLGFYGIGIFRFLSMSN